MMAKVFKSAHAGLSAYTESQMGPLPHFKPIDCSVRALDQTQEISL